MLDSSSSPLWHLLQNASLILLSFAFFLPDLWILVSCYILRALIPTGLCRRARSQQAPGFQQQNVLITGVGMAKGLSIARMFYLAGHDVVGADFEPRNILVNGRFSTTVRRFYRLPLPTEDSEGYEKGMIKIIQNEGIVLWISCSAVATAVHDSRMSRILKRETGCGSIQLGEDITVILDDKGKFCKLLDHLKLPVPETRVVCSRDEVYKALSHAPQSKHYVLKSIGIEDASRSSLTKLPMKTLCATYKYVSKIAINSEKPYILQEFVPGYEYCIHALVINNIIRTFAACRSSDMLMHYQALPTSTPLHNSLLNFTQEFVHRSNHKFTGHLSFDFIVTEHSSSNKSGYHLYPIECNPRAHTALTLFQGLEQTIAREYLSASVPSTNGAAPSEEQPIFPEHPKPVYWIGHDIVTLVLCPILCFVSLRLSFRSLITSLGAFFEHLLFWKEGTFEIWDPLPFFWLYHVYWPLNFCTSVFYGQWWSRANVSTTKMFSVK